MPEHPASPTLASACHVFAQAPGPEFQNVQLSLNLGESRAVAHLQTAWQQVASQHAAFHASFSRAATGETLIRQTTESQIAWTTLDWKTVAPAEIPSRWQALLAEDARQPFDLASPPLLRIQAIELPGGHCHQLVTFPKLLLDEDTLFHVVCEWLEVLEGRPPQEPSAPPAAPSATPAVSDWWARFFSRSTIPLTLAIQPPRQPDPATPLRQENTVLLDRDTSRDVKSLCQRLGIEPRDVFLAVWTLVLVRLSPDGAGLLLSPSAHDNLLPCQPPLPPDTRIESWLRDVARSEKDRSEHSTIGLERTLLLADPPRRLRDFSAAFFWAPPPLNDRIHDVFPRWINFDAKLSSRSQFPLTLQVRDGNRFAIQLETDPSLCPQEEAAALMERLTGTLTALLENPGGTPGEISILTESERPTFGIAAPAPRQSPPPSPVEVAFAAIAKNQPDALAVTGPGEGALSFSELDSHANSLASWLRAENLADGWNIGVCLTPTPWLPVAVLGILRAGDTCVPVEHRSSAEWLAARLESSDVELVICDSGTASIFDGTTRRLLVLDREWELVASSPASVTDPAPQKFAFLLNGTASDPAPDLCAFTPAFLAAACQEGIRLLEMAPDDRIPLLAAAGTGAFVETLLCPLLSGATLVLPEENDPLASATQSATHLRLSATQWRVLISRFLRTGKSLPDTLRTVCVETDTTLPVIRNAWNQRNPEGRVRLVAVFSPAGLSGAGLRVFPTEHSGPLWPAGLPGPGVHACLRDPAGQPLPPHHPGRLEMRFAHQDDKPFSHPAWRDRSGAYHFVPAPHAAVEEAFASLPEVLDVHASTVEENGRPLTAVWTVLRTPSAQISPETSRSAAQHLPASLRPAFVLSVSEFPLTPGGRIHDTQLPRPTLAPAQAKVAAQTEEKPAEPAVPTVPADEWDPLVLLQKTPEAPVLFLIHDFAGSPDTYRSLATLLREDWTLYATTARGLHQPSACHRTVETEAAALVEAVCLLDPDGPFHLCGYGYGAILAMEMARQLRIAGRQVPYLALVGSRPPETETRPDWRKTLTRVFSIGSAKSPPPAIPSTPVAATHQSALEAYRAKPLAGPAGIILGSDMGRDVEAAWLEVVPEAIVESVSHPSAQLLTDPAVKRLSVLLRQWTVPAADGE